MVVRHMRLAIRPRHVFPAETQPKRRLGLIVHPARKSVSGSSSGLSLGGEKDNIVKLIDGSYVCAQCGEVLDLPKGEPPKVTIRAASGKPNVRVLTHDGKEIHRCTVKQ